MDEGGQNTAEYQRFKSNFETLCKGISQDVEGVAVKAFQNNLLGTSNVADAKNDRAKNAHDRASDLAILLLTRIEVRRGDFYVILDILKSIPTLGHLVRLLQGNDQPKPQPNPPQVASKLAERPSTKEALTALFPVADKWKLIGTFLDIPKADLNGIEKKPGNDQDRLLEMVNTWLTSLDATWDALIEAVKMVDENNAAEIKREL